MTSCPSWQSKSVAFLHMPISMKCKKMGVFCCTCGAPVGVTGESSMPQDRFFKRWAAGPPNSVTKSFSWQSCRSLTVATPRAWSLLAVWWPTPATFTTRWHAGLKQAALTWQTAKHLAYRELFGDRWARPWCLRRSPAAGRSAGWAWRSPTPAWREAYWWRCRRSRSDPVSCGWPLSAPLQCGIPSLTLHNHRFPRLLHSEEIRTTTINKQTSGCESTTDLWQNQTDSLSSGGKLIRPSGRLKVLRKYNGITLLDFSHNSFLGFWSPHKSSRTTHQSGCRRVLQRTDCSHLRPQPVSCPPSAWRPRSFRQSPASPPTASRTSAPLQGEQKKVISDKPVT